MRLDFLHPGKDLQEADSVDHATGATDCDDDSFQPSASLFLGGAVEPVQLVERFKKSLRIGDPALLDKPAVAPALGI